MEEESEMDGGDQERLDITELHTDAHYPEPSNINRIHQVKINNTKSQQYNIINHQRSKNANDKHHEEDIGTEINGGKVKFNIISHTKSSENLLGADDDISPRFGNDSGRDDGYLGYKSHHNVHPAPRSVNKSHAVTTDPKYNLNKLHDDVITSDKYGMHNYKSPSRTGYVDGNDEYGITSSDSQFEYVGRVPSFGAKDEFEYRGGAPGFGGKRGSSPPAISHR